jgi:hypothetical protein
VGHYLKIIDTFASHPEVGVVFGGSAVRRRRRRTA